MLANVAWWGAACGSAHPGGVGGPGAPPSAGGAAAAIAGAPAVANGGQGAMRGLDLGVPGGSTGDKSGGSGGVGGGCAATFVEAKGQQLAMFIMLDQSNSMDDVVDEATMTTRWGAVTSALNAFVMNPAAATVPVGLQYFGLPVEQGAQDGQGGRRGGGGRNNSSCTASDYAKAEVPIAPLTTNAAAITASMAKHAPLTNTPTLPAVQGGVQFVASYATEHPEYKVVLVLATDGEPSGCNSDITSVSAAAAVGLSGTPSVETYVIGVGDALTNLNAIATAGGTKQAFVVSDANVQQDLITALTAIQGAVLPCQYTVPAATMGKALNFGKVNVQFTSSGGAVQEFQKVSSLSDCAPGGKLWYYDNNAAPKEILLCPDTCKAVTGDPAANVSIVLDCKDTKVQ
jgi:hypothetical protein